MFKAFTRAECTKKMGGVFEKCLETQTFDLRQKTLTFYVDNMAFAMIFIFGCCCEISRRAFLYYFSLTYGALKIKW